MGHLIIVYLLNFFHEFQSVKMSLHGDAYCMTHASCNMCRRVNTQNT